MMDKIKKAVKENTYPVRTCWECNDAHQHLKKIKILFCFACEYWYMNGKKVIHNMDIDWYSIDNNEKSLEE